MPYPTMELGRHSKFLNVLSKVAVDIPTPVRTNARLASCVVYKNNIVAFGVNEMKSHPFQAKFAKNREAVYLHAETSAIKNALKYITVEELEKSTLYVARVKSNCNHELVFGLSMPCPGCQHCINTFNLKKVVYTLDNGGFGVL